MAADLNSVALTGNLGRDAELRATQSGSSYLRFTMAVNRSVQGSDGNWADVPNWIDVAYFSNGAANFAQYLTKGKQVAVAGELRWSSWEKDGQKRSKVEVVARTVKLLTPRQQGQQAGYQQQSQQYAQQPQQAPQHQYAPPQGQVAAPGTYQPTLASAQQVPVAPPGEVLDADIPF